MTAFCPYCGEQHPAGFLYCPETGRRLGEGGSPGSGQVPMRWEYKEITIPLGFSTKDGSVMKRYSQIVMDELNRQGQGGWQVDEPTDFQTVMYSTQRLAYHTSQSFLSRLLVDTPVYIYDSVTFRLKRLVPA